MLQIKLPRLNYQWQQNPQLLERYWDEAMNEIERTLNEILLIPSIQQGLQNVENDIVEISADIETVTELANEVDGVVTGEVAQSSLRESFVSGFTGSLISADSTGTVTIVAHDRVYTDDTTVPVDGAVITTGAAVGDTLRFFYNDPSRSGGAVTYLFTTDPGPPPVQIGDTHVIGTVQVPASATSDGNYVRPPGFVFL